MKNIVKLTLAALAVFPILARADIGDTPAQSVQRYGQPKYHKGPNIDIYLTKDWLIVQWFDPELGTAQFIEYTKNNGDFSSTERDQIMAANLPSYLLDGNNW